MSNPERARQALADFAAKFGPVQSMIAVVESVDEEEKTCTLQDNGLLYYDVRLRPVINGKESITLYPKVGAYAVAIRLEGNEEWMVAASDEIDKYRIVVGETIIETDGSKIQVSNSEGSLRTILENIVNEMLAMYAPKNVAAINAIKININQLLK